MSTFQADTSNFVDLLQIVRDGDEICLTAGDYNGPFTIERSITIRGTGADTELFAADEPALIIQVLGVRLENLALKRTVGGDTGEVVLSAEPGTSPVLNQVRLCGVAENVQWVGASWDIPTRLDFGEVDNERSAEKFLEIELGALCQVTCELGWLRVKPIYLSPGRQRLDVELNAMGIPPGTRLSGSITLEAHDGLRAIAVTAVINASFAASLPPLSQTLPKIDNSVSENWGYRFVTEKAIKNFIRDVESQAALEEYPDFQARRNGAEQLMLDLVGEEPRLFYVRRKGPGQKPGEEKWELIIATDRDDVQLPAMLEERGKTLSLLTAVNEDGNGGLQLLEAGLASKDRGQVNDFAIPTRIRLLSDHRHRIGVPHEALERMAEMPTPGDCVPTEDQLQAWEAFLNIEERIARARQFCVPFVSHNYGEATRNITFLIDANSATVDGSIENSLDVDDFWQRAKQARNEDIKLFETGSAALKRNSRQLGTIEEVEISSSIIRVRLERDLADDIAQGRYQLPAFGFLFFEARGEIAQIERKKKALEDLENGRTQNPYLGQFLFDASQARLPQETVQLQQQDLLLKSANDGQRAAVEAVLAAPDLVLIQGPPGTGKTTVIAEICYQVARRGGRTLIASQANLAVDNALSRLVHNPVIRAVRKGKAEKVGEEGLPFLEDRVIGTWLKNTSADCEKGLSKRLDTVRMFRQLLASSERFAAYLEAESAFEPKRKRLQDHMAVLESDYQAKVSTHKEASSGQREVESLNTDLDVLLRSAPSVNWCEPASIDLLARLKPYASGDSVRNFGVNIREATALATKLGMVPPARGSFGLAAWLRDSVPAWIAQVRTAIAYALDAATAMADANSAAQLYTQNSNSLTRLRQRNQQLLEAQPSLQQEIENLRSRQSKLSLAMSELEEWSSTAYLRLYETLNQSFQERQRFTDELIPLPLQLSTIAQEIGSTHAPWESYRKRASVEVGRLIVKHREWEEVSKLERRIYSLLVQVPDELATQSLSEDTISKAINALGIHGLGPMPALEKLRQLTRRTIEEVNQSPGLWSWTAEKLSGHSRLYCAAAKLEAIKRQYKVIVQRAKPSTIEPTLRHITDETVNGIVTSALKWLNEVQSETEQRLHQLEQRLYELRRLEVDLEQQISVAQRQAATSRSEANQTFSRVIGLLQELTHLSQIPENLRILAEQYPRTPVELQDQAAQISAQVHSWESSTNQLETLITSLDPFAVLLTIRNLIGVDLSTRTAVIETALRQLRESQNKLHEIKAQLQQQLERLNGERAWWQSAWAAIPDRLKPVVPSTGLFNLDFLGGIRAQFHFWQQELAKEEAYLNRYQHLVFDWIAKLHNPLEQDRNELRRIYLDNANVIGITCSQSASRDFSEEFKSFDVVIIDEVSKCTPPELLIPALKAKKLVLVGDHRQLPPMLDSNALEDIAEELGSTKEELVFLEESLFKSQFEAAGEGIKKMLNTQYRMHPSIMGAINQFYDNKLECGLFDADTKRAHNLAGEIIQEHHHLIWVKTPVGQGFEEQRQGTSLSNIREVDVIERLCQQMDAVWASRVAKGEPKKEIAVITFYGAQLRKIDERLDSNIFPSLAIRTGTVDRFQGMERQVVIVSMVRNNDQQQVGFAKKPERVNVAFSRAQELLVIVGCHSLFTQQRGGVGSMYSNVSNVVRLHGGFVNVSDILC